MALKDDLLENWNDALSNSMLEVEVPRIWFIRYPEYAAGLSGSIVPLPPFSMTLTTDGTEPGEYLSYITRYEIISPMIMQTMNNYFRANKPDDLSWWLFTADVDDASESTVDGVYNMACTASLHIYKADYVVMTGSI